MTKTEIIKTLNSFENSFKKVLPEKEGNIEILRLCIWEIIEALLFYDRTKIRKNSLHFLREDKKEMRLDNILLITKTITKLSSKKDLENILRSLGHMHAHLDQLKFDAQNALKNVNAIMNKIADKLPDEE